MEAHEGRFKLDPGVTSRAGEAYLQRGEREQGLVPVRGDTPALLSGRGNDPNGASVPPLESPSRLSSSVSRLD